MVHAPTPRRKLILGVAASDCHVVANRLIAASLRDDGFEVVNLGACTSIAAFAAAYETHPDAEAVLIGSINGHAYDDLADLPVARSRGLLGCPVVVGGRLAVGRELSNDHVRRLHGLGVDVICTDAADLRRVLEQLRAAVPLVKAG